MYIPAYVRIMFSLILPIELNRMTNTEGLAVSQIMTCVMKILIICNPLILQSLMLVVVTIYIEFIGNYHWIYRKSIRICIPQHRTSILRQ